MVQKYADLQLSYIHPTRNQKFGQIIFPGNSFPRIITVSYFYRIFICILLYTVDTPSPEEIRPGYYGYLCGVVLSQFRGVTELIDQVAMTTTATAATTTGSRRPCPCSRGIDLQPWKTTNQMARLIKWSFYKNCFVFNRMSYYKIY